MGQATENVSTLPHIGIVFTGQFDRVEQGLNLLTAEKIRTLLISGANPKAGFEPGRFADQFSLADNQRNWLSNGRIILLPNANTTLENAWETTCWIEENHPRVQSLTLITSQRHMARASLALERALGAIRIIRVTSDRGEVYLAPWDNLIEARKFVATWLLTQLPRALWPAKAPANCALH